MWSSFAVALVIGALFLYVPGFFALRAFRVSRIASIACAPVVGVPTYAILCIAYAKAGIACSWQSVFLPALGLALLLAVASAAFERRSVGRFRLAQNDRIVLGGVDTRRDALLLLLYFALGVAFTTWVFLRGLDGSDSFVQELDNAHHLNAIRSFLDSGIWSSLSSSLYLAEPAGVDPTPGVSFYPSAWHGVAVMIVDATGVTITQGVNAANALFAGLVFPGCLYILMRKVFSDKPVALACGAVSSIAFTAFPWMILFWGPLYPNCASLCIFPAVAWSFMEATESQRSLPSRVVSAALFLAGGIALALLQPNAVFTAAVFLVPWCVHRVVQASGDSPRCAKHRRVWQAGLAVAFVAFAVAVWAVLFNMPFFESVVTHVWPKFAEGPQAIINILTLSFRGTMPQLILGVAVVFGLVIALCSRRRRWLAISYVLACVIYYACVTTDEPIKHWLAGFWYTDPVRLAANAALFAMPLAAEGFAFFVEKVRAAFARRPLFSSRSTAAVPAAAVTVLAVFLAVNFYPNFELTGRGKVETAFGNMEERMTASYSATNVDVYAPLEMRFVQNRVKEAIPEGAVVINQPNDGSVFAYALDGLDVMYRRMRDYGGSGETDGSKFIRLHLDEITTNEEVRRAVEETGAEYVLQLDNPAYTDYPLGMQEVPVDPGKQDFENKDVDPAKPLDLRDYRKLHGQDTYYLFSYVPDEWAGIDAVNDETPGFELVLREGDMRLYRIVLD